MGFASPAQLFDASWTAHRLSPLHHSKHHRTLIGNADALKTYAKRLHDVLAGDVSRGVQISIGTTHTDDALAKAGSLVECRWEHTPTFEYWDDNLEKDGDSSIEPKDVLGVFITIDYENITYRAALLAGPDGYSASSTDRRRKQSTYLPLLLTRMPNVLRQTFTQFLSTTFDAYCSVLRLPSDFLCATLEAYISSLTADETSTATSKAVLELALGETQLTLSFGQPVAPALKALDISLPRETLSAFALRVADSNTTSPFSSSLSQYLERHLAMTVNLNRPGELNDKVTTNQHVWLSKVASRAFVLNTEGRFKLTDVSNRHKDDSEEQARIQQKMMFACEQILRSLVHRAIGDDMTT